jgi:hypothetical protein
MHSTASRQPSEEKAFHQDLTSDQSWNVMGPDAASTEGAWNGLTVARLGEQEQASRMELLGE